MHMVSPAEVSHCRFTIGYHIQVVPEFAVLEGFFCERNIGRTVFDQENLPVGVILTVVL